MPAQMTICKRWRWTVLTRYVQCRILISGLLWLPHLLITSYSIILDYGSFTKHA
jgi:hypothetical protein